MAANADPAGEGHLIEFHGLKVRSVLNRSISRRGMSFTWTINPYRGCEFACRYCYARYTHEYMELRRPEDFERKIFIKQNAAWLLEQELKQVQPDEEIAIGTATDPYQPIERRMGITRSLLEVFARREGYRLGIVTKSTLIARDIDLLAEIGKKNRLRVHLTITTTDSKLARILEPRAPRPDLRFETVRKLRDAGITTGVLCSPLLPGITDNELALDAVAKKAAAAGANFLAAQPLFLKSCSRPTYLSFVREHFPHLAADYAKRFAKLDFAAAPYRRQLALMVKRVCDKHRLGPRFNDELLTYDAGEIRKGPTGVRASGANGAQGLLFA